MPWLIALRMTGTVDRIEGKWVVVEWSSGSLSDLPAEVFLRLPEEGDPVSMHIQRRVKGSALALPGQPPRLSTSGGLLSLPHHKSLEPGHRYSIRIRLPREADRQTPTTPVQEDPTHAKEDP